MNDIRCTVRYFDYGGYYSDDGDDVRWNPKESQVYALVMKTSIENVTYAGLVEKICKKILIDEATTKLKISYIPFLVVPKRPSHILDDEDVLGYLMEVNKDQCKPVLHVELIKDSEGNQWCEQDRRSEAGVSNKEMFSSGRVNDGINTIHIGEPLEHYELVDNVGVTYGKNASYEEFANVDNSGMSEDVELTQPAVERDECVDHAREDGIGLTIGQEFESKQAVQDLVAKGSLENCFEVATYKSDPKLYLVKCRGSKEGCKWSLRVAKVKNSDKFSVRTYNKMHTCSRVITSTSRRSTRKVTPRLVASILHEDYQGKFDIPSPKNIIDVVERRFGVKVSYSTALRGKKQAINDVRDTEKGDPLV